MENVPEIEQPESLREIAIGEEFNLFENESIRYWLATSNSQTIEKLLSSNILNTTIIKIPFNVDLLNIVETYGRADDPEVSRGRVITPFDPEEGYSIDSEDFNLESRLKKIERLSKELQSPVDPSKAPLKLSIGSDWDIDVPDQDLELPFKFTEETLNLLKKLRLLVIFPKGSFVARPSTKALQNADEDIEFADFYPIDSVSLAQIPTEDKYSIGEGLKILLPSDPEKLSQIRARFVLEEEQM